MGHIAEPWQSTMEARVVSRECKKRRHVEEKFKRNFLVNGEMWSEILMHIRLGICFCSEF